MRVAQLKLRRADWRRERERKRERVRKRARDIVNGREQNNERQIGWKREADRARASYNGNLFRFKSIFYLILRQLSQRVLGFSRYLAEFPKWKLNPFS